MAKMFSVSRQTVLKWINNGKIKAVKVVKVYRIPKEEIDRLPDCMSERKDSEDSTSADCTASRVKESDFRRKDKTHV